MHRCVAAARAVFAVALWSVLPSVAWAQSNISGLVTDTSGAVLPGVTVEAASPALIEKVRTAATDAQGRYSIVDVRPGVYDVTFTLSGFTSFKQQGIEVMANTNVPLNAELKVGTVEETVTVSGQSPVVDVQSPARTQVMSREVLDALPNSRIYGTAGVIAPGVKLTKPDIGGTSAVQQAFILARGFTAQDDNAMQVDGMNVHVNGGGQAAYTNFGMVQEVNYQTSAITADTQEGGVRINMIPKDGGNTFHGNTFVGGSSGNWQASNLTPDLVQRGLSAPTAIAHLYDIDPAVGGRIVRDRVWFWGSFRRLELSQKPGGHYPDGTPDVDDQWINSASARITWQINAKNKISLYDDRAYKQRNHDFTDGVPAQVAPQGIDPVTAASRRFPKVYYAAYGKWTSTLSNKMLLEAGLSLNLNNYSIVYQPGVAAPFGSPNFLLNAPRVDIVKNTLTGASAFIPETIKQGGYTAQVALTYATGSHNFKLGTQYRFGPFGEKVDLTNGAMIEYFSNGVPDAVTAYDTPVDAEAYLHADVGTYAQDTWTFKRLTLNPGVRWNYFKATNEASAAGAGRFVPARQFDGAVPNLPVWSNVVPRFGAVYDLRGDAKTAIKFSASKYMNWRATDVATVYNPMIEAVDSRNWFDCNLIPGTSTCSSQVLPTNGDGIAQSNEIGPSSNANFGVSAGRRPDPNLQREFNVEYTASVQHQLLPGVSVIGAWYHRRFGNVPGEFNALVNPVTDYTAVQTTNPLSGAPMTIFNLHPAKLGQVDNVDRTSSVNKILYTGYELSFSARLPHGGTALGGWTAERTTNVTCDANSPNSFIFCDQTGALDQQLGAVPSPPFRNEFKLGASYPLPWATQVSVSLLSFPGAGIQPTWSPPPSAFPNGQRTSPITVPLVAPGTMFLDRWNQVDIGGRRTFHIGRSEFTGQADVFNLFNSNVVLTEILSYGATLYKPATILQGRLLRLGMSWKF